MNSGRILGRSMSWSLRLAMEMTIDEIPLPAIPVHLEKVSARVRTHTDCTRGESMLSRMTSRDFPRARYNPTWRRLVRTLGSGDDGEDVA